MSTKHFVLISYSNNDQPLAEKVLLTLKAKNINCWTAFENISPGESWPAAITEAITQCKIFLLILTKNSNDSRQVVRELTQADKLNKELYCFQTEDILISKDIQYFFSSIHRHEAFKLGIDVSLVKMVDEICRRIPESERKKGKEITEQERPKRDEAELLKAEKERLQRETSKRESSVRKKSQRKT